MTMEWQTIDSAPKNEKALLLIRSGFEHVVGSWLHPTYHQKNVDKFKGCWIDNSVKTDGKAMRVYRDGTTVYEPTHWMYLPEDPEEE